MHIYLMLSPMRTTCPQVYMCVFVYIFLMLSACPFL